MVFPLMNFYVEISNTIKFYGQINTLSYPCFEKCNFQFLPNTGFKFCFSENMIFSFVTFRYQLSVTGSEGLTEIRWLYPIQGIPESKPIKDSLGAVVECKARDRLEERLEVTLSGVAPASSGPHKSVLTRSITPKGSSTNISDGIVVGESKTQFRLFSEIFFVERVGGWRVDITVIVNYMNRTLELEVSFKCLIPFFSRCPTLFPK